MRVALRIDSSAPPGQVSMSKGEDSVGALVVGGADNPSWLSAVKSRAGERIHKRSGLELSGVLTTGIQWSPAVFLVSSLRPWLKTLSETIAMTATSSSPTRASRIVIDSLCSCRVSMI